MMNATDLLDFFPGLNKYATSDKISVKANILDSYRQQHNLRRASSEAAWGEELSRRTKAPYRGDWLAAQLDNRFYAQRKCDIERFVVLLNHH